MKKVSIRIPDDHPLLQYPSGQRSKLAREWMEAGMALKEILERIEGKLDALLAGKAIEVRQPEGSSVKEPDKTEKERAVARALADALEFFC